MKYKLEVGLIFFLLLFFISIDNPLVYVGGILRRIPDLQMPANYACIARTVPQTARVLFLSNPDGTVNWNLYNIWIAKAQYQLVPRVLAYTESAPVDLQAYPWFLANGMNPQAIDQMARQNQLQVVQTCDKITVLKSVH